MSNEIIVAAALNLPDDKNIIILGNYHNSGIMKAQLKYLGLERAYLNTGFITSKGRFLFRHEAYKLAEAKQQLKYKPITPELYSDNIKSRKIFCSATLVDDIMFLGLTHESIENLFNARHKKMSKKIEGFSAFDKYDRLYFIDRKEAHKLLFNKDGILTSKSIYLEK